MIPRRIFGTNVVLGAPQNWNPEKDGPCGSLPARFDADRGTYSTAWEPTPAELALLNAGGSVVLTVVGLHPPVSLHTEALDGEG